MAWAELRPDFAKRRFLCAERASAHVLIARNNHIIYKRLIHVYGLYVSDCTKK